MIVGFHLGIEEQGIVFRTQRPDEAAQAYYNSNTSNQNKLVRSFAGLHAHLALLPESIEPHLREAYRHSIVFTPAHPFYNRVSEEERTFVSGARSDLQLIASFAEIEHPGDPQAQSEAIRMAEIQARDVIANRLHDIVRVVDDIFMWAEEPEREIDPMLLYSARRAKSVINPATS